MTDKKTIGLTARGEATLEKVMELGYFKDKIDAAKFAMSVAIRDGRQPMDIEGASTIWNVGTVDSDGDLRRVIPVLFPECEAPYRAVESLIDQGFLIIAASVQDATFDPVDAIKQAQALQ